MLRPELVCAALAAVLVQAAPAAAQQPGGSATQPRVTTASQPPAAPTEGAEPRLVFEREIFHYSGRVRRDPFRPLTSTAEGPLFTDLQLHMILYSEDPRSSVVSVSDAAKRQYRLRRGDSVGNATVIDIGPTRVVFSVLDFGIRRQEVLDLKETGRERSR
jgi:hypothetical protein